jgi:hypothetical protein
MLGEGGAGVEGLTCVGMSRGQLLILPNLDEVLSPPPCWPAQAKRCTLMQEELEGLHRTRVSACGGGWGWLRGGLRGGGGNWGRRRGGGSPHCATFIYVQALASKVSLPICAYCHPPPVPCAATAADAQLQARSR